MLISFGLALNGMKITSETDGGQVWRPKHIIVETSTDGNVWTTSGSFTAPSIEEAKLINFNLDNPLITKHVRISIDEVFSTNWTNNLKINEIDLF